MEKLTKKYSKMYQMWLTKHVLGCCGTNKQISYWNSGCSAMCPSCGNVIEITLHVKQCRDPGKNMLRSSVGELTDWIYETSNDYDMVTYMSKYLMSQGELAFGQDRCEPGSAPDKPSEWTQLVEEINGLGWDCLLEGKVSKQWKSFTRTGLKRTGNPMSPEGWTKNFIDKIICTRTSSGISQLQSPFSNQGPSNNQREP